MHQQARAYAFAGTAVLLWSTVPSAFKLSLRYLDPLQLLLYANATSIVVLFAILTLRRRLHLLRRYTRRDLLRLAALGVLNPFLYYVVLFKAYDLLPAHQTAPLTFSWAIPLALLSVPLLGQRITLKAFAALLISYAGVPVISTNGDVLGMEFTSLPGVMLALASTVIWAFYWIYRAKDGSDPVAALLVGFCFSLPLVVATTAVFSEITTPHWEGVAGGAYAGVFEMGISYVLWLQALKRSSTTAKVGNLIFLAPFGSLVFIHLLVGEPIVPATIVGLTLIVTGNVIQQWPEPRRTTPKPCDRSEHRGRLTSTKRHPGGSEPPVSSCRADFPADDGWTTRPSGVETEYDQPVAHRRHGDSVLVTFGDEPTVSDKCDLVPVEDSDERVDARRPAEPSPG